MRNRRAQGIALTALLATFLTASAFAMDEAGTPVPPMPQPDADRLPQIDPGFVHEFEDRSNDTGFVVIFEDQSNDTGFIAPIGGTREPNAIMATPAWDIDRP